MAITAVSQTSSGSNLSWADFTVVSTPLVDPADGSAIDAYTNFDFNLVSATPVASGTKFKFQDPDTLRITPNCQVHNSTAQTAGLLAHESFHFDLGFCVARVVAKKLMKLEEPTQAALRTAALALFQFHFRDRTGLIQRRYDADTHHGTSARYQRIWATRMTACKADAKAKQLGGYWL